MTVLRKPRCTDSRIDSDGFRRRRYVVQGQPNWTTVEIPLSLFRELSKRADREEFLKHRAVARNVSKSKVSKFIALVAAGRSRTKAAIEAEIPHTTAIRLANLHFGPADRGHIKKPEGVALLRQGWKVEAVAHHLGVGAATAYRWRAAMRTADYLAQMT